RRRQSQKTEGHGHIRSKEDPQGLSGPTPSDWSDDQIPRYPYPWPADWYGWRSYPVSPSRKRPLFAPGEREQRKPETESRASPDQPTRLRLRSRPKENVCDSLEGASDNLYFSP